MINLRLIYLQAQNNKNSLVNLKNILLLFFHLKYNLIFQVHLILNYRISRCLLVLKNHYNVMKIIHSWCFHNENLICYLHILG